ncbi:histone deacetylation protein Rxt3-domain-containing protein [Yarrowia lipolytica]|uniref:Histone deacetylation protein Rxt3-domain-containing protein n=1 Tax=Yarrowia lipolytica TaxID=4952 RepID=A0A371CEE8_YARLL|nr:Hypothetical protein YALI2_C00354g [Yarrowia lipolytica]RDW28664.1 histone deacetylation protein Rxt3-domain-containing protein [Yarrowia lipolytica]RDW41061.1 histone deacetylation protein Rxt3-domain-containing protein [Yarrowia lipolytica]RDW45010.1 histone deacetylation protein Rxt3-domain-containing protein [Yarrowia lipolytica]RDW54213.1 histone deacetylation protein Rxt3-domain-containing protein [Yarrowia lipolytica]
MNSESQASEPVETASSADKPTDVPTPMPATVPTTTDGSASEATTETQPATSEAAAATTSTTETPAPAPVTTETGEVPAAQSETTSTAASAAPAVADKDTPSTEQKNSSPARMSLSFIQGDEPKKPEANDPAPSEDATPATSVPEAPTVAPNAAANAAAASAETTLASAEPVTSEPTVSAQESTAAAVSPSVTAPVDNADAATVAADDADAPGINPKEPKSLQKHAHPHPHPHPHKHHHHHHHHHRSFRNLKSKQDVNNKDVYSFVKATPFPKTDLGVLEYTTNLDTCLQGVLLPNLQLHVDCTIQVLIPRKHLRKESNILVQRREIWGTDIYTDDSDIVSVLYHTGVLPTRAQVDAFYSTLRAQEEGDADDTTDGHLEDEHPVTVGPNSHLVTSTSDNEQIYGDCLVTLRALPKLTEYTGCYRNGINSRSWKHHDGGSYAIQKVEFLKHDQAEYVLRRNKRSRLNTWSDQQKWAEWSSHKEVVLDFKDDQKGKKATVESLMS